MKDLLSASLMASIIAVQPKRHMVSEAHCASSMMGCDNGCAGHCEGNCRGDCMGSCKGENR